MQLRFYVCFSPVLTLSPNIYFYWSGKFISYVWEDPQRFKPLQTVFCPRGKLIILHSPTRVSLEPRFYISIQFNSFKKIFSTFFYFIPFRYFILFRLGDFHFISDSYFISFRRFSFHFGSAIFNSFLFGGRASRNFIWFLIILIISFVLFSFVLRYSILNEKGCEKVFEFGLIWVADWFVPGSCKFLHPVHNFVKWLAVWADFMLNHYF